MGKVRRLVNIEKDDHVSLVVDRYEEKQPEGWIVLRGILVYCEVKRL